MRTYVVTLDIETSEEGFSSEFVLMELTDAITSTITKEVVIVEVPENSFWAKFKYLVSELWILIRYGV